MNRSQRATIAKETLKIVDSGKYTSLSGKRVFIRDEVQDCIAGTKLYRPADFDDVADQFAKNRPESGFQTKFEVVNATTFAAAHRLTTEAADVGAGNFPNAGVACLNFASAKNPGGGFLSGSQAQEECLARASALYDSINPMQPYYEANRNCGSSFYTEHMIFSPAVPVFRNDADELIDDPWCTSIITSPSVNRRPLDNRSPELSKIPGVMRERISNVLMVAAINGCRSIVLGAWGCGVFRNEPQDMANWFGEHLTQDGLFADTFENVVFAVLDSTKQERFVTPFKARFDRCRARSA